MSYLLLALLFIGFGAASNVSNSYLFFKNGICGVNLGNNAMAIVNTASESIDVPISLSNNAENADPSFFYVYMVGFKNLHLIGKAGGLFSTIVDNLNQELSMNASDLPVSSGLTKKCCFVLKDCGTADIADEFYLDGWKYSRNAIDATVCSDDLHLTVDLDKVHQ